MNLFDAKLMVFYGFVEVIISRKNICSKGIRISEEMRI